MDKIEQTAAYVKLSLDGAEAGHDWWHIYRVWQTAKTIAVKEQADIEVVEYAALLHDIADSKFNNGDEEIGPQKAGDFLRSISVNEDTIHHVQQIIRYMSFKASLGNVRFQSKELDVVQDADRLDAIGAMGIARAFSYGGYKQRGFYDPEILPNTNITKEEYKNSNAPTINHFYEKLLLLKDKMNTAAGKELAIKRHQFMEMFLEQFYGEWEGRI
ncbi:MAG: HD domain-containing protein [Sphingobacteriaceae bacterium]|nr:HD domain-containing protein [Sphingobacteriaceae bacterium]